MFKLLLRPLAMAKVAAVVAVVAAVIFSALSITCKAVFSLSLLCNRPSPPPAPPPSHLTATYTLFHHDHTALAEAVSSLFSPSHLEEESATVSTVNRVIYLVS